MPSLLLTTLMLHDDLVAKDWDESQHPREPAGSAGGGQFASGGGAGGAPAASGPGPAPPPGPAGFLALRSMGLIAPPARGAAGAEAAPAATVVQGLRHVKQRQYEEAVRAAGRDPAKLAQAAVLGARLGLGGVKTLARAARNQAEQAGRGLTAQHPEFKVRTPVRAQDLARSAVQRQLGIQPKPRAPKPVMGAAPANRPPVAPVNPPGPPMKPLLAESPGGAGRQRSFTGTGFERPQIGLPLHAAAAAGAPAAGADEAEHHLLTAKVIAEKRFDGSSVNETRFVTFGDGSKGVFKPRDQASWTNEAGGQSYGKGADEDGARGNIEPGKDMLRETAAYQVAKLVGMTDMVPATVVRTFAKDEGPPAIRGRTGSLQQFVPDSQPAAKPGPFGKIISDKPPYDGSTDFARAAVFDYAMGNEDRHPGNWMVDKSSGKLHLIDHGLTLPEDNYIEPVRGFMANAGREGRDSYKIGDLPPVIGTPREFAEPYIQNKAAILGVLTSLGLPKSAVDGESARIDDLASWNRKNDWKAMNS